jgi:hypothetical protein
LKKAVMRMAAAAVTARRVQSSRGRFARVKRDQSAHVCGGNQKMRSSWPLRTQSGLRLLDEQDAGGEEDAEDDAHSRAALEATELAHELDKADGDNAGGGSAQEHREGGAGAGDEEAGDEAGEHGVGDRIAHEAELAEQEEVAEQAADENRERAREHRGEVEGEELVEVG